MRPFYYYAQQEYATESLDFIRTAETFAQSGDLGLAKQIYDQYVADGAPQQINISGPVRADLDGMFGEGGTGFGPPNLFDSACTEIRRMVAGDTFRRFRTSAVAAQEALGQQIDWDNVTGR